MSGIKSKVFKKSKDKKYIIGYEKEMKFDKTFIETYKKKFYELKIKNIIIDGEFEGKTWVFLGRERKAIFTFDNDLVKELNLAIKMYLLLKIYDEKLNPRTLLIHFHAIKFIIKNTESLSINKVEEIDDVLHNLKDNIIKDYIVFYSIQFLYFYNGKKYEKLIDILKSHKKRKDRFISRQLPDFKSIIFFDYILTEFIDNCTKYEKEKYYAVILWWNITKTIPMRPIELVELETNCVRRDKDKFILRISKCNKGNKANSLFETEYREVYINEELYNLIEDFISLNDPLREQKYLLNYDIYYNYIDEPNLYSNEILKKYRDNMGGTGRFYSLLNKFYTNIVEKKYQYKTTLVDEKNDYIGGEMLIQRIRPGDTRHFAICNLYLQGFNPLTIARLAGHDNLYTQLNYAKHLNTFADSQVKVLTDKIRMDNSLENKSNYTSIKEIYKKSLFFNIEKYHSVKKVENGYCIDEEFPNNCSIGECITCKHFRIDVKKNKDINDILLKRSNSFNHDIKRQIEIIKKIIKNSNLNKNDVKKNRSLDIQEQQDMGIASKKLQEAISKKAIIDSYIFRNREVEESE